MTEPRRLLTRLLEYIEERAKEIDPRQFCLSNAKGFIRRSELIFERSEFDFEYPLLTQAAEIALDEMTMSLEIRPRSTQTRIELDAFVACSVPGATEVERSAREYLVRNEEHPVTPFDPASFTDVLKHLACASSRACADPTGGGCGRCLG